MVQECCNNSVERTTIPYVNQVELAQKFWSAFHWEELNIQVE